MDAKMNGIVSVEPYNHIWKIEFHKIRQMLEASIGDLIIAVEHVGSTAVEGLAAKPILDIDVVMESYAVFPAIRERLAAIGFVHEGDLGLAGREAFKRTFVDEFMPYHLYVCPKDSRELHRHIAFRDYLRCHPGDVKAYGDLKSQLAESHRTDIGGYMQGKAALVAEIFVKALMTVQKESQ
jgi:GrpB-like predicted nucleotidyltransferase (UPF0157 family)